MTIPVVTLPRRLQGATLSKVIDRLVAESEGGLPPHIQLEFSNLSFIEPAGVVFLSNLIHWLNARGVEVTLSGVGRNTDALRYLDDSLFFAQHCGRKVHPYAHPRDTTRPLMRIAHAESHGWLDLQLIPWLAINLGTTEASLYFFKACISELFNNIIDHTNYDVGSIFVQHFPRINKISIGLADFGPGIPEVVSATIPGLSDEQAILQAVQEGFTTKSKATNQGVGLSYLIETVVRHHGGSVTFYSSHGIVRFTRCGAEVTSDVLSQVGFCPGTTIEIELQTDSIERLPEEREDLQW